MKTKWLLLVLVLACFPLCVTAQQPPAAPLASVAFLEGGTWLGEGKWPDGSALRVEVRYFWGPTKRVLHFETHDLAGGQRKLLYEGMLFFEPKRGRLVQYNFKPDGGLDESELSEANAKGYDVRGTNTWSLIRYTNADAFRWELRVQQAGEWKLILDATYRRRR